MSSSAAAGNRRLHAYFLARQGIDVIVVEQTEVAAAASGKAGAFLALDWCAGSLHDVFEAARLCFHGGASGRF